MKTRPWTAWWGKKPRKGNRIRRILYLLQYWIGISHLVQRARYYVSPRMAEVKQAKSVKKTNDWKASRTPTRGRRQKRRRIVVHIFLGYWNTPLKWLIRNGKQFSNHVQSENIFCALVSVWFETCALYFSTQPRPPFVFLSRSWLFHAMPGVLLKQQILKVTHLTVAKFHPARHPCPYFNAIAHSYMAKINDKQKQQKTINGQ